MVPRILRISTAHWHRVFCTLASTVRHTDTAYSTYKHQLFHALAGRLLHINTTHYCASAPRSQRTRTVYSAHWGRMFRALSPRVLHIGTARSAHWHRTFCTLAPYVLHIGTTRSVYWHRASAHWHRRFYASAASFALPKERFSGRLHLRRT